jgi:hypothetical protein
MDTTAMELTAYQMSMGTQIIVACIGFFGVAIGAIINMIGNYALQKIKEEPKRKLDERRIQILKEMLDDSRFKDKWRYISTLSAVIGTDKEETKRLLILAGARGSEINSEKWGLLKHHKLPGPKEQLP